MSPACHGEGLDVVPPVVCGVMALVFFSLQLLPCCRESNSVRLATEGPRALSVSDGAKLVANGDVKEGAMAWQSKGCCGKGCAAPCPGNGGVPEMDDCSAQAAKRRAPSPSLETGHAAGSASCRGKCLQDDTWHKEPRAAFPWAVRARLAFSWAGTGCNAFVGSARE